ncbi:MAG: NAD(P)/FAD-dependent oxidoreductase [Thermoanaerobaculales bacterium]|nr:NAD(P)/FAD-dependent oxidoreductase [Thermoanaerobaculales bacterium]
MAEPDLLVVGGGPAGLATAIEARMAGLSATVVDRRRPPIDGACGEGLMPGGVARLLRLGVEIEPSEARVFHGIRYLDGETRVEARFAIGAGVGVRRTALHRSLARRAEALGAELLWGVTVRGLVDGGIVTDAGVLRGRVLAAADGRLSPVRRWAGIPMAGPVRPRFGIRRHYRLAPWTDLVEVYWADHAEAYVTPVGPEMVGVAVLTRSTPLDLDRAIHRIPALARRLEGARPASRDRGAGPFGQRAARVVSDRVALVGDAAGSLDPITGEGLSVAFAQAEALVRTLVDPAAEGYPEAHRRIMRLPRRVTGLLLVAEARPALRRLVVRSLAAAPRLFAGIVDAVGSAGIGTVRRAGSAAART